MTASSHGSTMSGAYTATVGAFSRSTTSMFSCSMVEYTAASGAPSRSSQSTPRNVHSSVTSFPPSSTRNDPAR